jgi:hypothetical protein
MADELATLPPSVAPLADGSAIISTRLDADGAPLLHFVMTPEKTLAWALARDVRAAEVLFDEEPLVFIATLEAPDLAKRLVARLLPTPFTSLETLRADEALPRAMPSTEWTLTYLLLTRTAPERLASVLMQLHAPGNASGNATLRKAVAAMPKHIVRARALKLELTTFTGDDDDRRKLVALHEQASENVERATRVCSTALGWISAVNRRRRALNMDALEADEVLLAYGSVACSVLDLTTPLTRVPYATGLFVSAAHMWHSCAPSASAFFMERGRLQVVAREAAPAGTRITLDRFLLPGAPFLRCIQTAPAVMRDAFDAMVGARCACTECVATLNWLRSIAAAANGTDAAGPVPRGDIEMIERTVESTWVAPPSKELAAVIATLSDTSVLRAFLTQPLIIGMAPNVASELTASTATQAALRALFEHESASLASIILARVVYASAWHAHQPAHGIFSTELVAAAFAHARRHGSSVVAAKLAEQGAVEARRARGVADWETALECAAMALACTQRVETLATEKTHADKVAALKRYLRETSDACGTNTIVYRALSLLGEGRVPPAGPEPVSAIACTDDAFELAIRCLRYESLFAPHVGFVMACASDL